MTEDSSSPTDLLNTISTALTSAGDTLQSSKDKFLPPAEGISLLDVKNDLLLSYLQNLAFLILLKIRNSFSGDEPDKQVQQELIEKLVQLRVYLERGVKPLEAKLRYQIDSALRAAENVKAAKTQR